MTNRALFLLAAVLGAGGLSLTGCDPGPNEKGGQSTPTQGRLLVGVDETFAPIMQAEVDTFSKLYTQANVKLQFEPEEKVFVDFINGDVTLAVAARQLNAEELGEMKKQNITPQTTHIGIDGLAILLHPSNPDSLLTLTQLRAIFTGQTTQWSQLSGHKTLSDINVVFDANRSSTTRFVRDSLTRGAALTSRAFATKSNPALIDYVATHPNAIGVVGVNWISDRDDPKAAGFLTKVRVAAITARPNPAPADFIQPYQVYLAEKTPEQLAEYPDLQNYPLRRNLYIISREARTGLGTGFASFVAAKNGQLIFQKSGLMPAHIQARIVTTK